MQKRWPVKDLWGGFIDAKPFDYDWMQHEMGDEWGYFEAVECENCHTLNVDLQCENCDDYLGQEGPMMNYAYPVDVARVGGPREAAIAIAHLPLCIVEIEDHEPVYNLALTGGGMDLSWEIVEAYMRLGYLPPMHFCGLPHMAGMRDTPTNRWICSGIAGTLNLMANRVKWAKRDLKNLRSYLKGGK